MNTDLHPMNNALEFVAHPASATQAQGVFEEFEMAFESLLARFHVTIRQLDRFASGIDDDVVKLHFLDELISGLTFFETHYDHFDPEAPVDTLTVLPGEKLIETAIWLCEKSAEARHEFGEIRLAKRIQALGESCHEAYEALPTEWKIREDRDKGTGRASAPSLEAVAA